MPDDINLDYCSSCGGALRAVDGTDADTAERIGHYKETYRCQLCGATGTFTVGVDGSDPRGSGAVVQA